MAVTTTDERLTETGIQDAAEAVSLGMTHHGARRSWSFGRSRPREGARFRIASLTKPFTATAAVLAARRADVSLDTPVLEVLPTLAPDWRADPTISLSHVLAQASGLSGRVTADEVAALGDGDGVGVASARLVGRAGSVARPGDRWAYDNGNYYVAGAVVAALNETSYEQALAELVLQPWGLEDTGFEPSGELVNGMQGGTEVPRSSYPRGRRPSGGLCSTAADLVTFGERLVADQDLAEQLARVRTPPGEIRYGLGWAIGPNGQMYLNGRLPGFRAALVAIPDQRFVAVALTNDEDALPAAAGALSVLQMDLTGDDLGPAINDFAA